MAVMAICAIAFAGAINVIGDGNTWTVRGRTSGDFFTITDGAVTNSGTLAQSGAVALTGALTGSGVVEVHTPTAASLTSPTVTFDVSADSWFTLNSDANLTGVYPTGGTLNQVIYICAGGGSNTIQFDDGTSMSIGANFVVTETQNDVLGLRCLSADGDDWAKFCSGQN